MTADPLRAIDTDYPQPDSPWIVYAEQQAVIQAALISIMDTCPGVTEDIDRIRVALTGEAHP